MTLDAADKAFFARTYADALDLYMPLAQRGNVEALAQVARCLSLTGKLEEGRAWLERARTLASTDDPSGWSRFLGVRGVFERESGDIARARATFEEMHAYCLRKGLPRRAIDALHHLAIIAPLEEQPERAMRGIAAAEKIGDHASLAVLWNNLGAAYEEMKKYDRMMEAYLQARDHHARSGGDLQKLVADWTVGHGYRLNGRFKDAREILEKTLAWAERRRANDPSPAATGWTGLCRKDLGQALAALGEKAAARDLLTLARRDLVDAGYGKSWPEMLQEIDASLRGPGG